MTSYTEITSALEQRAAESPFLQTAFYTKMVQPQGLITYLSPELGPPSEEGYPTVSMKVKTQAITAETYQSSLPVHAEQLADVSAYGVDIQQALAGVLVDETLQNLAKKLLKRYRELAEAAEEENLTKWQRFTRKWWAPTVYLGGEDLEAGRRLLAYAVGRANRIAQSTRRGPGNFLVVNPQLGVLLEDQAAFVYTGNVGLGSPAGEPFLIGHVHNIQVFVDPYMCWDDTRVLVGRKSNSDEPAAVVALYRADLGTVDQPESGNTRLVINTRAAVATVPELAEGRYRTFHVTLAKQPLWKRLLRIS